MGVIFDKLSFVKPWREAAGVKRLEDAGTFTRLQAEALSEAFHQAVAESVATKQDVDTCRTKLQHEVALLRGEMKAGFAELRSAMSESRVWAVGVAPTVIAVLAAIRCFG